MAKKKVMMAKKKVKKVMKAKVIFLGTKTRRLLPRRRGKQGKGASPSCKTSGRCEVCTTILEKAAAKYAQLQAAAVASKEMVLYHLGEKCTEESCAYFAAKGK
jgi:hypothetical protein